MAIRFGGNPTSERRALAASGIAMRSVGCLWLLGAAICITGCASTTPPARTPQGSATDVGSGPASQRVQQEESASATAAPPASAELSGGAKEAYDRGFKLWMTGDLDAARSAFSEAANQAGNAAAPRYSLGCVLERLGATQDALDAYRAAYAANPKYEAAIGGYALLLARAGHSAEAEQFLADKRAALPDSLAPTTFLAEVKSIEGDSAGCQLLAQQVLAKEPDSKEAMIVIARDFYRNHRWDLASYALQAILDGADDGSIPPRDKANPVALLLRGLIERETGQRKQALADFELATEKRPDLFEGYVNLGEMKLEAGNATEAEGPLEKAAHFGPNLAVVHLDLGDCYRLLGRTADAKKELMSALNMDSTLVSAHYDLGLLYLFSPSVPGMLDQDDQLAKAIQEFEAYKSMRSAKSVKGLGADVDELLSTAKRKQSELQLKKQAGSAPAPTATAPPPTGATAAPSSPPETAQPSPAPSGGGTIVRDLPQ
jgi:tetratricopeptide (TPR) repeat protein